MLKLNVVGEEFFDEEKGQFFYTDDVVLEMEHSLASLSKWESIWKKPFIDEARKTSEETISYIKCMLLSGEDDKNLDAIINRLSEENINQINEYIGATMTATWFSDKPSKRSASKEVITAELIYYWMVSLNIPFECQYWHLDRLFTLVKVCNEKNQPQNKLSKSELAARNRALNAERKARYNTAG